MQVWPFAHTPSLHQLAHAFPAAHCLAASSAQASSPACNVPAKGPLLDGKTMRGFASCGFVSPPGQQGPKEVGHARPDEPQRAGIQSRGKNLLAHISTDPRKRAQSSQDSRTGPSRSSKHGPDRSSCPRCHGAATRTNHRLSAPERAAAALERLAWSKPGTRAPTPQTRAYADTTIDRSPSSTRRSPRELWTHPNLRPALGHRSGSGELSGSASRRVRSLRVY